MYRRSSQAHEQPDNNVWYRALAPLCGDAVRYQALGVPLEIEFMSRVYDEGEQLQQSGVTEHGTSCRYRVGCVPKFLQQWYGMRGSN